MSLAEAQRFATDLSSDAALKAKVMAMPGDTPEQRIAAAKSAGYDFSLSDLEGKGPMDDSSLEGVAGGGMVGNWFKKLRNTITNGWNNFW